MKGSVLGKILYVGMVLALALAFSTMPASASAPADVTIVSDMELEEGQFHGIFEAYGSAVDAGIICASGTVEDVGARAAGQSPSFLVLFVHKLFVCDDGSGSFEMDLNVKLINDPAGTTAVWQVVAGDGAYARLHGNGKLTGAPTAAGITDTYTGRLHID